MNRYMYFKTYKLRDCYVMCVYLEMKQEIYTN